MDIEKKIGKFMNVRMGITMSFVMSAVGSFIGVSEAAKNSPAPFVVIWLPSFIVSFIIASIIALIIGTIIPMKKFNDGIENLTKLKGFLLHVVQSIISNIIYTLIIATVMAFVSTALFALPNGKKALEGQIAGKNKEKAAIEAQIAEIQAKGADMTAEDEGMLGKLNGDLGPINGELGGMQEGLAHMQLVPMAMKSLTRSFLFEYIFATIVIIIVQPLYMKKALKKYVPNFDASVDGDENI